MPFENLNKELPQLRRSIDEKGLRWQVQEVDPAIIGGLGADLVPESDFRVAEAFGSTLMKSLRAGYSDIVLNRAVDWVRISEILLRTPGRWDWRDHGAIGPVTDQRQCGSCVSFATVGLVSAQAAIELGVTPPDLSQADQHFASAHGAHCGGWNNHSSLDEVRKRGISAETSFPYLSAFDSPPRFDANSLWIAHDRLQIDRPRQTYTITNFTAHSGADRKRYLATVGPLIMSFKVYEDFSNYAGGQYSHAFGRLRGGHAVLVVGYDDVEGSWICRNSWGTRWGGSAKPDGTGAGYFRLKYGDSGVDNQPMYGCRGVRPPKLRSFVIERVNDIPIILPKEVLKIRPDLLGPITRVPS